MKQTLQVSAGLVLVAIAAYLTTLPLVGGWVAFTLPALAVGVGLLASAALDALGVDR